MITVAAAPTAEISPRFFGEPASPLFGIYHGPAGATVRNAGVILCYPGLQEYDQMHWAYQKTAGMLAAAGFHVLRFDYSGAGDSSGASADASIARWTDDLGGAVEELKEIAGIRRVSLVGARLGAIVALRGSAAGMKVRDLVLWDPVVSGAEYLAALELAERRRLSFLTYPEPNTPVECELLGYPMTSVQRAEIEEIDLLRESVDALERVQVVSCGLSPAQASFCRRLESLDVRLQTDVVDDPCLYAPETHPGSTVLSHNIPAAIVSYLSRGNA